MTADDLKSFISDFLEETDSQNTEINDVDSARNVLTAIYKEQGFKPTMIELMLNALDADGVEELIKEAINAKQKNSKTDTKIAKAQEELQQKENKQKVFVESIKQEVAQLGWKPKKVNAVMSAISGSKLTETINDVVKNPKALIQLADFLTYYNNGNFDLTSFVNQGLSSKIEETKKNIVKDHFSSVPQTSGTNKLNPNKVLENLEPII